MMLTDVTLELPYPPSVNGYWRQWNGRTLVSKRGRQFRVDLCNRLLEYRCPHVAGRLRVEIMAHRADRRAFDIDNLVKPLLDAMQHGRVFDDDGQIDELRIVRGERRDEACVIVRISQLTPLGERGG